MGYDAAGYNDSVFYALGEEVVQVERHIYLNGGELSAGVHAWGSSDGCNTLNCLFLSAVIRTSLFIRIHLEQHS